MPEVGRAGQSFSAAMRSQTALPTRLHELAILVVSREWSAKYPFFVHSRSALKEGVSREVVEAVRQQKTPHFHSEEEKAVYDAVSEVCRSRTLRKSTYDSAVSILGLDTLIMVITAAGFYSMVATLTNAFDMPVPGGEDPFAEEKKRGGAGRGISR